MTRLRTSFLGILCTVVLALEAHPAWCGKAAVVISRSVSSYNTALEGFKKNTGFEFELLNMDGDLAKGEKIMAGLPLDTPVVVAFGTEAAMAAKAASPSMPVLYTMVLEPMTLTGRKACGVVLKIGINDQFERLQKYFPNRKRIGVLYNPAHASQDIEQARRLVDKYGFSLVAVAVEKADEVANALSHCTRDQVDMLWMVVDATLVTPECVQTFIRHAQKESLPLVGLSMFHVKAGAFLAFSVDLADIGRQTRDVAGRMIKEGLANRVETPQKIVVYVNNGQQNKIGVNLSAFPEVQMVE